MAEYHVRWGIAGLYAGILKSPDNNEWLDMNDVTDEAFNSVVQFMYSQIHRGENSITYSFKLPDGKWAHLRLEANNKCPEWAKAENGEEENGG